MSKLPLVAIVGQTNAGKSSLFNRIVGKPQAVVAREEGTTRDRVLATVKFNKKTFTLVDTAGLKKPEDDFEANIQNQIAEVAELADAIIVTVDGTTQLTKEDEQVARLARKTGKKIILAVNKSDIKLSNKTNFDKLGISQQFRVSANHGTNVEELLVEVTSDLPKIKSAGEGRLKVAFIGRPNVGKSALFNNLSGKQGAIVADLAGTTRDVNRINLSYNKRTIELLDTAGIRRSGKIGKGVEEFSVLRTMLAIEEADICCLLIDVNEPNTKLDMRIAGLAKEANKGLIIIVSKWDSIEKTAYTRDELAKKIQYDYQFAYWASLIFTSSITGQNVSKLLELFTKINKERTKKIDTKDLNRWLQMALLKQPPAARKTFPKLKYITQTGISPPEFTIFGRNTDALHFSYRRYLENSLREEFGFEGTAIEIIFKQE